MLGVGMPGGLELIIILFIAILIFGTTLPKVISKMGSSIRDFRLGLKGGTEGENKQA